MKRYRLIQTACLAALAVGFASCSQDELSSLTEGVEGAPVTFNASGIAMTQVETRATVDGTWEDGMSVAVKIGSVVKEYAVTPNADDPKRATLAAADGVTPFVWASITEKKNVQAWYPYTAGETTMPALVVQQDQSIEANYLASDLLSVSKQVTYGDNNLQFAHRTAKITLRLEVAQGSTVSMENAQVILHNLSTANGNPGLITCFDASAGDTYIHNALIAPQTFAAGKELLKIVLSDGKVFGYVPDKAVNFQAGCQYPLTITLTDTGIKVTVGEAIHWGDEVNSENSMVISEDGYYVTTDADGRQTYYVSSEAGLNAWAEYTNQGNWGTNLTLMNNITMTKPEDGSSNWTPIGYRSDGKYSDKYAGTIEGNGYTIDNMVVNTSSSNFAAMIVTLSGTVQNLTIVTLSGTVQNLTIGSGSYFHAKYWSASVTTNVNGGKVINCHSAATVNLTLTTAASWGDGSIGGIVANNRGDDGNSYVIGCSFSGLLTADAGSIKESIFVGGVVGSSWTTDNGNQVQVVGCVNSGGMIFRNAGSTTTSRVGGVVGSSYKNGNDLTNVTGCVMAGIVSFEGVTKRAAQYSAFDAGIGEIYNAATATYVYWTPGSIAADYKNPYHPSGTYSTLQEVDGNTINWATATANVNTAIEEWNASNGNLCPNHFEQQDGANQPPTLVDGMP